MSGTNGSIGFTPTPTAALPSPRVRIVDGDDVNVLPAPGNAFVPLGMSGGDNLQAVAIKNAVQIALVNIPEDAFDPALGLRLELVRYRRRHGYNHGVSNRGTAVKAGFVHPANQAGAGPSGMGFQTHGGIAGGRSNPMTSINALRETEWQIGANGGIVNVSQSVLAFMELRDVAYRSVANVNSKALDLTQQALIPGGNARYASYAGRRFAWSGMLYPGRFAFRYSIIDLSTAITGKSGGRVVGPVSETVMCTNRARPFTPLNVPGTYPVAEVTTGFDPLVVQFWVEGRVPTAA